MMMMVVRPIVAVSAVVVTRAIERGPNFKKTASELTRVAERLNTQGGVIDRLADGAAAMTEVGQSFGSATLPRLNRTSEEAARTARQVSRTVSVVSDNPQSLIFGNGFMPPGPGEPGFSFPKGAQ